jgi:hypothetical protein
MEQLALNLTAILIAGIGTLYMQRRLYVRRRRAHLEHAAREAAGLPLGYSRHDDTVTTPAPKEVR